ncbi:MAG: ribonuclease P protein component [Coriobacteriia bacterium]|nr:ribonuclease P protein component [Coriobacteriia bacterium]
MRTITAHSEIERLFREGRRVSHPALLVLAAPRPQGEASAGRALFVAGKRLGGAVVRNRSKRVLRETVRRMSGPWAGWDVALIARPGTADADARTLDEAVNKALESLGIV